MLFNDLPTFHDGGSQSTPSTYFVAKALLYPNQNFTIGNLKYLSTEGHLGIAQETSLASLNQKFNQAVNTPSPDLYLVLTSQMTGWMSSISKIANWDIELGKPVTLEGNQKVTQLVIIGLNAVLMDIRQNLNVSPEHLTLREAL